MVIQINSPPVIYYLIHLQSIRLFSPKGYSGGHSRLAGQILCTHGSWITLSVCLPHARPSPHAVSKEGTFRSSEHSRGKPDLWLLSSWISVTADAHVMRSNQTQVSAADGEGTRALGLPATISHPHPAPLPCCVPSFHNKSVAFT